MLPASLELLEAIGALGDVRAAGFPVKRGGVYVWGKSRDPWMFRFGERNIGTAYQVERGRFDDILLGHARREGVDVRTRHQVVGILDNCGRTCGVSYKDHRGRPHSVRSRWVLDASGQAGFIGSRRGTRLLNQDLRNLAVYGYWRGDRCLELADVCRDADKDDRNSIFIEACRSGWWWWIPLGEDHFSVGGVVGRDAAANLARTGLKAFYLDAVGETDYIRRFLARSAVQEPIRVIRDWSYRSRELCGAGFALLGDAAAFVDPILSTGVFLAINAGVALATVLNTIMRGTLEEDICLDWYRRVYNAVYDDYEGMVKHWYFGERTQNSWFWQARRALPDDAARNFRESFILIASGLSHSVHRELINAKVGVVTYLSKVNAVGAMGSPSALRRVAAMLELEPAEPGMGARLVEPDLTFALMPMADWTLSYALIRPDGYSVPVSKTEGKLLREELERHRVRRMDNRE
jgi:FAD-dependent halogenase